MRFVYDLVCGVAYVVDCRLKLRVCGNVSVCFVCDLLCDVVWCVFAVCVRMCDLSKRVCGVRMMCLCFVM